jgi:transcriptional regulator with XRE-family HTH domain
MNPKNRLKRLRLKQGLSQAKIAYLTGIHPSTISLLERSIAMPNQEHKRKIARALKANIEDVFPNG